MLLYYNPGYHHVRNAHVKIWDPKKKEKGERIFIERVENGLVLTTDWFNDNKREKRFWLVPDSFFMKRIPNLTMHPAHKYCVYWTIFCNPTRSFHTRTHTHTHRRTKNVIEGRKKIWKPFASFPPIVSPPPLHLFIWCHIADDDGFMFISHLSLWRRPSTSPDRSRFMHVYVCRLHSRVPTKVSRLPLSIFLYFSLSKLSS